MQTQIPSYEIHFDGPIIMIGFGSIGKATLPLIKRHIKQSDDNIIIISPDDSNKNVADEYGARFIKDTITKDNYQEIIGGLLGNREKLAYIINVANEVGSKELVSFAALNNSLYLDTVVEPWPGLYFNTEITKAQQSNYAFRHSLHELKETHKKTPTAISCCGANPGMVSWFVKEALLNLAADLGHDVPRPNTKVEWAVLMKDLGVKGIHIAERDTQTNGKKRPENLFVNTWSAEGCLAECLQPAELGWGTHEEEMPPDGHMHTTGNKAAIYLDTYGGEVQVQTWTPTAGAHKGFLVTHNEAISISDYFTVREGEDVVFRPTCHYAYHPSDATVESLKELFDNRNAVAQEDLHILTEAEIIEGADELGVLLYGHAKGAYWYGSRLDINETRELAPHQNATALQVSSAILAGMFYSINNPSEGLVETDEINFEECLKIQKPYLGKVFGAYTDWQPAINNQTLSTNDPWQFKNIRINPPIIRD